MMRVDWMIESENMNLHEWLKVADYCNIKIKSTDDFRSVLFSLHRQQKVKEFFNGIVQFSHRHPEKQFNITYLLYMEERNSRYYTVKGGKMVCGKS